MATKLLLHIKDMDCSSCVVNIDSILEDQEGIMEARTSYAKGQTAIVYNPLKIKPQSMQSLLKEAGYDSEIVVTV